MNSKILKLIESRLDHGKQEYAAELDINDGREWQKEALEEILDTCVYVAAKLLQLEESKKD